MNSFPPATANDPHPGPTRCFHTSSGGRAAQSGSSFTPVTSPSRFAPRNSGQSPGPTATVAPAATGAGAAFRPARNCSSSLCCQRQRKFGTRSASVPSSLSIPATTHSPPSPTSNPFRRTSPDSGTLAASQPTQMTSAAASP